jgi:D-arabinitol 4-dehydrogenase
VKPLAVAAQIVAALQRHRARVALHACFENGGQRAVDGGVAALQVRREVRVSGVEPVVFVEVIAALGDREGNDLAGRVRAGRPAWERVGAELVDSVVPYEEAKIRILNATHSCIAWAGTLVGLNYIHEGTLDPEIRQFAYDYVTQDVIPCLTPSPLDLARYRDVVLDRFSNPHIQDTNQRVAADGFSKIPGFIAPTLAECFARGVEPAATAVLPALFFRFLDRWQAGKLPYKYQDGVMDERVARAFFAAPDPLQAFGADRLLWGSMAQTPHLEKALRGALARVDAWLARHG